MYCHTAHVQLCRATIMTLTRLGSDLIYAHTSHFSTKIRDTSTVEEKAMVPSDRPNGPDSDFVLEVGRPSSWPVKILARSFPREPERELGTARKVVRISSAGCGAPPSRKKVQRWRRRPLLVSRTAQGASAPGSDHQVPTAQARRPLVGTCLGSAAAAH